MVKKLQVKYVVQLLRKKKFKKLYNLIWSYALWLNYPLRTKLVADLYPSLFKKEPYPPFIEIETTTKCPFTCKICEHTYWNEPSINMSFEQFQHIVDQFPKLKWAGITGIGESWSNPRFGDMVRYLTKKSDPIIELVDNFSLMNEKRSRKMIEIGVDIFFISMMGASKETYEKIMGGMKFDKVTNNIKTFLKLKKNMNSVSPLVNFHYIICRTNIHESLAFLDYVAAFDSEIYEVLYTPILHTFKEIEDERISEDEVHEIKFKLEEKGRNLGIHIAFNECLPSNRLPIKKCSNWIMPFFFANGEVNPCCATNEANLRDRQNRLSMGNIYHTNFKDIWWGQKYEKFRMKIRKNKAPAQCAGCPIYLK
jgi:radical SAM protein with 4Fe4S-binding SPASM domain